jgi:hypothetical protein
MADSNIYNELSNLQTELARLSSAVTLIESAKKTSVAVVNTGEKLNALYQTQNESTKALSDRLAVQISKLEKLLKELEEAQVAQKLNTFDEKLNGIWQNTNSKLESMQLWIYIVTMVSGITLLFTGVFLLSA